MDRQGGFFMKMSDDELVGYAHGLYGHNVTKGELYKKDGSLYHTLQRRGLTQRLQSKRIDHKSMSDDELVGYAHEQYGEDVTKGELYKKDGGLYKAILRRKLTDKLKSRNRDHKSKNDEDDNSAGSLSSVRR